MYYGLVLEEAITNIDAVLRTTIPPQQKIVILVKLWDKYIYKVKNALSFPGCIPYAEFDLLSCKKTS